MMTLLGLLPLITAAQAAALAESDNGCAVEVRLCVMSAPAHAREMTAILRPRSQDGGQTEWLIFPPAGHTPAAQAEIAARLDRLYRQGRERPGLGWRPVARTIVSWEDDDAEGTPKRGYGPALVVEDIAFIERVVPCAGMCEPGSLIALQRQGSIWRMIAMAPAF